VPRLNVPLADRFEAVTVDLKKPSRLCMPVTEDGEDPGAPGHAGALLCYQVKAAKGSPKFVAVSPVFVRDQFAQQTMKVTKLREFCLPSSLETS
jgi:hypothetical protein